MLIEELGAFVHGVLSAFHALGVVYNIRKKNYVDAAFHSIFFIYDLDATRRHWRDRHAICE